MNNEILNISNLEVAYHTEDGDVLALRGIDLVVHEAEFIGIVGESGSGKSTLAYSIIRLLRNGKLVNGQIHIAGTDVFALKPDELREFRWDVVSMVFQGAMNSLNPILTVKQHIYETLSAHEKDLHEKELRLRTLELLDLVGIDKRRMNEYPHQLSGGMKQRVVIALAMALRPKLIIMDEPTTALDVVVQKAILDKIRKIQKKEQFSVVFISHDLGLIEQIASKIFVMYAGKIVECTTTSALRENEMIHHPYTEGLLAAIPKLTADDINIRSIPGNPPEITNLPAGCAFNLRCQYASMKCSEQQPELRMYSGSYIACHNLRNYEDNVNE